jgi:hypothetical protein
VIPTTQLPSSSIDQPLPPPPVIDPFLLREPIIHNSGLMPPSVDPLPEPHRRSQMPPIFNTLWQTEQEIHDQKRRSDASRLADMNRSKHTVIVYAWTQNDQPPNVFEYQDGFEWPFFPINHRVLTDLEFTPDGQVADVKGVLERASSYDHAQFVADFQAMPISVRQR